MDFQKSRDDFRELLAVLNESCKNGGDPQLLHAVSHLMNHVRINSSEKDFKEDLIEAVANALECHGTLE